MAKGNGSLKDEERLAMRLFLLDVALILISGGRGGSFKCYYIFVDKVPLSLYLAAVR
jgi:hypothetical protein